MEGIWVFLGATATVLTVVSATLAVLRRPMAPLLAELCGGQARGDAWIALLCTCAILGSTAASTFPAAAPRALAPGAADVLLLAFATQCVFGLGGVLFSLVLTGSALYMYIRRVSACDPQMMRMSSNETA